MQSLLINDNMAAAATAAKVTKANLSNNKVASLLDSLLCPTIQSFHDVLVSYPTSSAPNNYGGNFGVERKMRERLIGIDETSGHVSLSICDSTWHAAVPFGIYMKTSKVTADAKLLESALNRLDDMTITGVVINTRPNAHGQTEYLRDLFMPELDVFPGLRGVVMYSEAHALRHTLRKYMDFKAAVAQMPRTKMEAKRRTRFDVAMDPDLAESDLVNDIDAINRISASETLQTVLDQITLLEQKQPET